jgi:Patatin-like phospholipase
MSSLPREVHEVLEHEYASMYGPLRRLDVAYDGDDIIDAQWAVRILRACELDDDSIVQQAAHSKNMAEARELLATRLNQLVGIAPPEPPLEKSDLHRTQRHMIREKLVHSPALTSAGHTLIQDYDAHFAEAKNEEQLDELNRRIVDDAFTGAVTPLRDLRLRHLYRSLHDRAKEDDGKARSALCISGGGIRSATFALGVIQGLASAKILDKFDYLSTVSGGGYIGSWLSSWARRHPHGISGVQEDLGSTDTAASKRQLPGGAVEPVKERTEKLEPEPKPVRHLRDYSNYLSPRLGILSGDAWTMGALYLRNLLLNLLVLVPILAAVLAVPRAYAYLSRVTLALTEWTYPIGTVIFAGFAFAYIGWSRPVEFESARSRARSTSDMKFFVCCIVPLICAAITLTLFWTDVALDPHELENPWLLIPAAALIAVTTFVPFFLYHGRLRRALENAPRKDYPTEEALKKHLRAKTLWEFAGAALGLVTSAGLLALLATEVFNRPLQGFTEMIEAAALPPALRAVGMTPWSSMYTIFAVPAVMLVFFIQASIFVGVSSRRNGDLDREWWGRAGAWLFIAAAGWMVLSGIAVFGPVALYNAPILLGSIGGASGVGAALLGFSAKTPANKKEKEEAGMAATAGNAALSFAVPLFVIFFLALISLATTWLTQKVEGAIDAKKKINWTQYEREARFESQAKRVRVTTDVELVDESPAEPRVSIAQLQSLFHLDTVYNTSIFQLVVMLAIAGLAWLLSRCIGVNKFSMHALYANRLTRAYLGASRYSRQPNPFTGFDERDKLQMYDLRPELLWPTSVKDDQAFYGALRDGKRTTQTNLAGASLGRRLLAQYLWSQFYDKTKLQIDKAERVNAGSLDAVVQNVNAILLRPAPLDEAAELKMPDDFWANTPPGHAPYPTLLRNRAVLDYYFGDTEPSVIRPMPRPNGAPSSSTEVATRDASFRETGEGGRRRGPLHLVNIALNLVGGEKLAWQQRKAMSFTTSPYHTGSLFLGYRDSREYGGDHGIGLGTAVTISGAAASPNMGYHSSPFMAFLLTLFNVRLGWWLGNPGPAGNESYKKEHPDTNLGPILKEAIGQTNDTYDWVYLSDGGHFENLGLYEMVLRRCHYIVLSDGGADPHYIFEDLGNAIRKIRTDMGVPIDIEEMFMFPRGAEGLQKEGRYVATATIRYTAVDGPDAKNGLLIYLKPGVYQDEYFPRDVYNYALESRQFPHEPTSDQFFSESQFESYRALGRHAINEICCNYPDRDSTARPRIPIAKQFTTVGQFANFVEDKARASRQPSPEQVIAQAIREARPRLRR